MKNTFILSLSILSVALFAFTSSKLNVKKSFDKFLKKGTYTLIPSGKAFVSGEEKSVQSFYMSKGEVTNFQYREFLSYLKSHNELEKLKICQIDTANWANNNGLNKTMSEHYHSHPAYNNYPVVNISHEAAQLYCEFVSKSLSKNFPDVQVEVRLPSYTEYVRAARGEHQLISYGWGSHSVRNSKGQVLGNFMRVDEECITRNSETGQLVVSTDDCLKSRFLAGTNVFNDFLAPSESYWPNQFGVYNLSGNAAEMIDEKGVAVGGSWNSPGHDVRIDSRKTFEGTDKTVGFRTVFTYISSTN